MKMIKNISTINEVILTPKQWEQFKKLGDNELYKKFNKYSDYSELRIYIEGSALELEAHCCIEKKPTVSLHQKSTAFLCEKKKPKFI